VLGLDDADIDVEVIALAAGFYRDLGLRRLRLVVNSMGDPEGRAAYVDALRTHLLAHTDALGDAYREKVEASPLRVLDSKNPDWQDAIASAPQITEHLGPDARAHFERVQEGLQALGIDFELDPRLVRGFDYYTRTTFEFQSDALDAAQNAVGGGGRYDGLAEAMGGPATPGIGFGIGVERLMLALEAEGARPDGLGAAPVAFVVDGLGEGGGTLALTLTAALREAGIATDRAYGGRALKGQWKAADRSGARFGVMLGRAELERGAVAVKDLGSGEQVEVPRDHLIAWIQQRLEESAT
jgi:histidyl-tRNA synthetase